ncbi:fibronectin type III domain-containing protein [bacterium]|nr:fibronectin type III domain-containing protein [bacterium]PJA77091.1 MAG: hypothetical protein CO151_00675 [bacterium CG_4_9_14_3_um_filter_65_15]
MSRSRLFSGLLVIVVMIGLGSVLPGCESKPAAPEFDNPFDGNDPLDLKAIITGNSILLTWTTPPGMGITSYELSHSFQAGTGFEFLDTVDATSPLYTYAAPDPTTDHYFKVQAFTAAGEFSLVAATTPTHVATGPAIAVNGDPDGKKVPSREVLLTVTVSSEDSILIATSDEFADAVSYPVATPGAGQDILWQLPQTDQDSTVTIFAKGYTGALASAVSSRKLTVDFSPEFFVTGKPATVASRLVDLEIDTAGVEQMRFALSEAGLAAASWLPPDSILTGFPLADVAVTQTISGEFQGDFGFNATSSWDVEPELLQGATFRLDLPADDVVAGDTVTGVCKAGATLMRFSTEPTFLGSIWQAYADTAVITLASTEGLQTIYAQFRNDWADSGILTDTLIHVVQPVSVGFLAPLDGQVVLGGVPLQVQGFSTDSTTKVAADSVAVDLADGLGFRSVTETDPWTFSWDVPRFDADTDLVLRARAWAAGDSTTAVVQVTVTQLTLAILEPTGGAELVADTDMAISGTTGGLLGGPAIDQVTVEVDGQTLTAEGTGLWTATWHTPAVVESTPATIKVTMVAGTESYSRVVAVTVVPALP